MKNLEDQWWILEGGGGGKGDILYSICWAPPPPNAVYGINVHNTAPPLNFKKKYVTNCYAFNINSHGYFRNLHDHYLRVIYKKNMGWRNVTQDPHKHEIISFLQFYFKN